MNTLKHENDALYTENVLTIYTENRMQEYLHM